MSTNNTDTKIPTLEVPMIDKNGKPYDAEGFAQAAFNVYQEREENETQANAAVKEAAEKVWSDKKTPAHLQTNQLTNAILNVMGNVFAREEEITDIRTRVKKIYATDDRFVFIPRGLRAGMYQKSRLSEKEIAELLKSKSEDQDNG